MVNNDQDTKSSVKIYSTYSLSRETKQETDISQTELTNRLQYQDLFTTNAVTYS